MIELNKNNFNEILSTNAIVIVDFWASWCGPCKTISPILEAIEIEHNAIIGKVNVDDEPDLSIKYNVKSIPTILVFENGIPVKTIIGAMPKHRLEKELDGWI